MNQDYRYAWVHAPLEAVGEILVTNESDVWGVHAVCDIDPEEPANMSVLVA